MKTLGNWIVFCALVCAPLVSAQPVSAEGMPLPWPFPWAKSCPLDWEMMKGRFMLKESSNGDWIDLRVSSPDDYGRRRVDLARVTRDGTVVLSGSTEVNADQNTIGLFLRPTKARESAVWAEIRLHYESDRMICANEDLVPILTLQDMPSSSGIARYSMVKVYCW